MADVPNNPEVGARPPAPGFNANAQPRRQNPPNAVGQYRDRLFHAIFFRSSVAYGTRFTPFMRRIIEMFFLLMAFGSFGTLVYVHVAFTQTPSTCLQNIRESWPRDGVLRVEIVPADMLAAYNDIRYKRLRPHPFGIVSPIDVSELLPADKSSPDWERTCAAIQPDQSPPRYGNQSVEPQFRPSTTPLKSSPISIFAVLLRTMLSLLPSIEIKFPDTLHRHRLATNETLLLAHHLLWSETAEAAAEPDYHNPAAALVQYEHSLLNQVSRVEYSLHYGFLRMPDYLRVRQNVSVKVVRLDPARDRCFGDTMSRTMLSQFLGYDDLLMTSLKWLAEEEDNKGFLRNCANGDHFRFVTMWNRGSYVMAFFVMILFTVSISMLLRYSHHQIFVCIVDLLQMMETNGRFGFPAAPLLTVILALVGMEAIMSEFFNDTTTAFYIILIVWICDQYDAICCHTSLSKRHWLRFFYLYHYTFYAYHYRFNGQYSSLALWSSSLFILHSMLYFFHHYELPVIMQQHRLNFIMRAHNQAHQRPARPGPGVLEGQTEPVFQAEFIYHNNETAADAAGAGAAAAEAAAAAAAAAHNHNDTNNNNGVVGLLQRCELIVRMVRAELQRYWVALLAAFRERRVRRRRLILANVGRQQAMAYVHPAPLSLPAGLRAAPYRRQVPAAGPPEAPRAPPTPLVPQRPPSPPMLRSFSEYMNMISTQPAPRPHLRGSDANESNPPGSTSSDQVGLEAEQAAAAILATYPDSD